MKKVVCRDCNGTGAIRKYGWVGSYLGRCDYCSGVGYVRYGEINEDEEKEIGEKS